VLLHENFNVFGGVDGHFTGVNRSYLILVQEIWNSLMKRFILKCKIVIVSVVKNIMNINSNLSIFIL
jgi:hypothetical protein